MNQFMKTRVPGFQVEQQARNEWESKGSWPQPTLVCNCNIYLQPEVGFKIRSGAKEGSYTFLGLWGARTDKGLERKSAGTGLLKIQPCVHNLVSSVCQESKLLVSHPPPPAPPHLLKTN